MAGVHGLDLALHVGFPACEKFLAGVRAERRWLEQVLDTAANDVELALKGEIAGKRSIASDEYLADDRHGLARCLAQWRRIDRHGSPAQYALPFFLHHTLEGSFADMPSALVGRQEYHAGPVSAWVREFDADLGAFLAKKCVRHLDEDAGAVAGVFLAAAGAAMLQILENLQRIADDVVRLTVLQVDDEADAAGIVFVARVVETLRIWERAGSHGYFFFLAVIACFSEE